MMSCLYVCIKGFIVSPGRAAAGASWRAGSQRGPVTQHGKSVVFA